MISYLDTSALVKKYVQETGTSQVLACWRESESIVTSVVAFAEVMAAFQRRKRESVAARPVIQRAVRSFRRDWESLVRVAVTEQLNDRIEILLSRHPLRGFDAIHLASATFLRDLGMDDLAFVCADERLTAAARLEELRIVPETWA